MKFQITFFVVLNLFFPNFGSANQDEINKLKKLSCQAVFSSSDEEAYAVMEKFGIEIINKHKISLAVVEENEAQLTASIQRSCTNEMTRNLYLVIEEELKKLIPNPINKSERSGIIAEKKNESKIIKQVTYKTVNLSCGGKYTGEWANGHGQHGQGTYTHPDGLKYVGEWKFHKRHGQGTETRADGSKYVGEWKDDNFHGQGTYTTPDGHKYVGEWRDGNQHGQGTLSFSSGEVRSGLWRNGYFVGRN